MNPTQGQGQYNLAWNLYGELRKELVEAQKTRIQIIGFKITFVSAALAVIGANLSKIPNAVLALPAFAGIFFDLLVNSYSFSIKRIGSYCRLYLEPILRRETSLSSPPEFFLWEEYLMQPQMRQILSFSGNLGLTLLASAVAVTGLTTPFRPVVSSALLGSLGVGLVFDVWGYWTLRRFRRKK